jgi:RHS repeat-associated protein
MGYFLTSDAENAAPGNSLASPKTHTPLSRVEERGLRFYSPEVGRWINRDPIQEEAFWLGRVPQLRDRKREVVVLLLFVHNDPNNLYDPDGLAPGGVKCTKDCQPQITGCDTLPKILQPCCEEHEELHIGQCPNWCKNKNKVVDYGCGVGAIVPYCTAAADDPLTPEACGKSRWPDLECPAYAGSVTCEAKLLDGPISLPDRRTVEDHLKAICDALRDPANKCENIPEACNRF